MLRMFAVHFAADRLRFVGLLRMLFHCLREGRNHLDIALPVTMGIQLNQAPTGSKAFANFALVVKKPTVSSKQLGIICFLFIRTFLR